MVFALLKSSLFPSSVPLKLGESHLCINDSSESRIRLSFSSNSEKGRLLTFTTSATSPREADSPSHSYYYPMDLPCQKEVGQTPRQNGDSG